MKTFKYFLILSGFFAILVSSCQKLDIKNENDPDFKKTVTSPSDVKGLAGSQMNTWFNATQNYDGPGLALWVTANAGTCSWGNRGMRDFGTEPRKVFDNTPAYGDAILSEGFYKSMNSVLSSSNDILSITVKGGMIIKADDGSDETPMVKAMAYLTQGLSLGYLGLIYDKAFIVTENTNLDNKIPTSPYMDLIDSAVVSLDKCIAICNTNTFTMPANWVPGISMTQTKVRELASSMAARFLSYSPRNLAENNAVDWAKVLTYANNGLTADFSPQMDAPGIWYDAYKDYANSNGWGQTDMRVVHMMSPGMPARWTGGANGFSLLPAPVTTHTAGVDDRIFTDFQFLSSCPFNPERGYYFFSCYRSKRFDDYLATYTTTVAIFRKAENDLLKAEALLHQPSLAAAAAIINAGTRVTRGALAPIAATATEIENAIFYERNVELFCTGMGIEFFTMRKANKLQPGTVLHLPIPGQQLAVNLIDYYTFGGSEGVAGKDISDGGWFK